MKNGFKSYLKGWVKCSCIWFLSEEEEEDILSYTSMGSGLSYIFYID